MSNGKSGGKKILPVIVALIFVVIGSIFGIDVLDILENEEETTTETLNSQAESNQTAEGVLILTMIDVGQADSFLLEQNGMTALIDCGTRYDGDDIVKLLKEKEITKIDYLFGTHPHDDHMGGMQEVITSVEIGKIIIPDVEDGKATSNWYENLMLELVRGDYDVEYSKEGAIYNLGDAKISILTQFTEYESSLNNYSAIMKVSFGEMDIIMTGDAENIVEEEALKSGVDLDAEILKVGHHGSDTSSSEYFLDAISPEYALISVGLDNKYKHPIKSTMENLEEREIEVYRTDESGTVVVTITSDSVSFSTNPDDYLDGITAEERYGK